LFDTLLFVFVGYVVIWIFGGGWGWYDILLCIYIVGWIFCGGWGSMIFCGDMDLVFDMDGVFDVDILCWLWIFDVDILIWMWKLFLMWIF